MKASCTPPKRPGNFRECSRVWEIITTSFKEEDIAIALNKLPEHVVVAITYHLINQLSIAEMSKVLERSPSVLRNKIHFGIFQLHRHFYTDNAKMNPYSL